MEGSALLVNIGIRIGRYAKDIFKVAHQVGQKDECEKEIYDAPFGRCSRTLYLY